LLETRSYLPILVCGLALIAGFVIGRQLSANQGQIHRVLHGAEQAIQQHSGVYSGAYQIPTRD